MSTKIPTSVLASRIIGLALLIILCLPAIGVEAQTPIPQPGQSPIRMQVEAAYDGNYKYGEWLPVWVELENNGSDLKGEVRARIVGGGGAMVFAVPVELPAVSRKRLPVYVLANNFSRQVDVSLIADGQTLASAKADVNPQVNLPYFAGLVAPERGILSLEWPSLG